MVVVAYTSTENDRRRSTVRWTWSWKKLLGHLCRLPEEGGEGFRGGERHRRRSNTRNPRICRAFPRSWSPDLASFRRGSLTRCVWEFSELFTIWEPIVVGRLVNLDYDSRLVGIIVNWYGTIVETWVYIRVRRRRRIVKADSFCFRNCRKLWNLLLGFFECWEGIIEDYF